MRELAEEKLRCGVERLHVLLRREGLVLNHKHTERIYWEEQLSLRDKRKKKKVSRTRVVFHQPQQAEPEMGAGFRQRSASEWSPFQGPDYRGSMGQNKSRIGGIRVSHRQSRCCRA